MTPNQLEWLKFASGQWLETMPTTPGVYPTKTFDGHQGPEIVVYELDGYAQASKAWGGFWWSEPYPMLPDCKK